MDTSLEMDEWTSDDSVQEEPGACAVGAADNQQSPERHSCGDVTFRQHRQKSPESPALEFTRHTSWGESHTSGEERHAADDSVQEEAGAYAVGAADDQQPPERHSCGDVTFRQHRQKSPESLALEFTRHTSWGESHTSGEERHAADDSVQEEAGAYAVGAADDQQPPERHSCGDVTFRQHRQKSPESLALDFTRHTSWGKSHTSGEERHAADDSVQEEAGAYAVGAADDQQSPERHRCGYVTFSQYRQKSPASPVLEFTRHTSMEVQTSRLESHPSGEEGHAAETPLGSLERTEVSLGHSDHTMDSNKFIRAEWGTRGTMHKIYRCIKSGSTPVDVHSLVSEGPVVCGQRRLIAARCFTSILNLKQHGFIRIQKDSETLEIKDIGFGDKIFFDK